MFELLPPERYLEIIPLYEQSRFINAVRSHLERTPIAKEVFVDNLENPKTVAIVVKHRAFLGGDSTNRAFNHALRDYFFIRKREILESSDIYEIDFYFSSDDWIETLSYSFTYSFPYPRYYYEIKQLKVNDWKNKLPKGYTIEQVDLSLLEKKYLVNYDWLIEEIEENWLPFEENLKEVRGYYIIYNEKDIVAWCTSEYQTQDNHIEVGIATRSEHRNKGLAKIVGSATAELCIDKYKTVGWHCNKTNVGSWKTAESIGFEKVKDYQKIGCFFNKLDNFIIQGYYNFIDKNYDEAIKYYKFVIDAYDQGEEDSKTSAYLTKWDFTIDKLIMELASFLSAKGDEEECLKYIRKATDLGYHNLENFKNEKHFKFLHNSDEWNELKRNILTNKEN